MKKYFIKIKGAIFIQILFSALFTLTLACFPYLRKLLFDLDYSKGLKPILFCI